MGHHPPAQRSCGRCSLPATYRVALIGPSDKPSIMFARRSHYRCADHFRAALAPHAMCALARDGLQLVVDPAYTASVLAVTS